MDKPLLLFTIGIFILLAVPFIVIGLDIKFNTPFQYVPIGMLLVGGFMIAPMYFEREKPNGDNVT